LSESARPTILCSLHSGLGRAWRAGGELGET
jgi:hypothetical protein